MGKRRKAHRRTYCFTVILTGVNSLADLEAGIYGAGCDDALVGIRCGTAFVEFDREGESFLSAIVSALHDVKQIGEEVRVVRIEPDDLVNMSEIAARVHQSRESIRKYVNNERGDGDFPLPVSSVTGNSPLWRWNEVAGWFAEKGKAVDDPTIAEAAVVSKLNAALELRRLSSSKRDMQKVLQLVS